jgi:hypothetical protein
VPQHVIFAHEVPGYEKPSQKSATQTHRFYLFVPSQRKSIGISACFLNVAISSATAYSISFSFLAVRALADCRPRASKAVDIKYCKSFSPHLFAIWAMRDNSELNASSRSNNSKGGAGSSRKVGGKT